MRVHREPLDRVEQLYEQVRRPPVRGPIVDRVAEERAGLESRQPGERLVAAGVARGDDGADPVLRILVVLRRCAAQPVDERAAAVEAVDARRAN
jgi:hypothetical protein